MIEYIDLDLNGSSLALKMMWKSMHKYGLSKISLSTPSS